MTNFEIPNLPDAAHDAQAFPTSTDIDILAAGFSGNGIVSGVVVTAHSPANMSVDVSGGFIFWNGSNVPVTGANLAMSPSAVDPRRDLVVVSSTGVLSIVAGTPQAIDPDDASVVPLLPDVPANSIALESIDVAGGALTIVAADLLSKTLPSLGSTLLAANTVKAVTYFRAIGTTPVERWHFAGSLSPVGANGTYGDIAGPNVITAVPHIESRGGTLDRLAAWVQSGGAAGKDFRIAVYRATSDTSWYPNTLVLDSGVISSNGNGLKQVNVSQALAANTLYWFCLMHNSAVNTMFIRTLGAPIPYPILGIDINTFTTSLGVQVARNFGLGYPSTFPAGATLNVAGFAMAYRYSS